MLPEAEVVSAFSHAHQRSSLWRIRSGGGHFWLKSNFQWGKWVSEQRALTTWAAELGKSPRLIAAHEPSHSFLMTEAPGTMATELDLSDEAERRLWREAGEYQSRLHQTTSDWFGGLLLDGSPNGESHRDPVVFVRSIIEGRLRQGVDRGLFGTPDAAFIGQAMQEWCEAFAGEPAYAIHRDFGPRNWLTDSSGALLAVIDWEHSRWDVRSADLNRAWDDRFVQKPSLAAAFLEGYGPIDARLGLQIRASRLQGAVGTIVWAREVGDTEFEFLGRAALERLKT